MNSWPLANHQEILICCVHKEGMVTVSDSKFSCVVEAFITFNEESYFFLDYRRDDEPVNYASLGSNIVRIRALHRDCKK